MKLWERALGRAGSLGETRMSLSEYIGLVAQSGFGLQQTIHGDREEPASGFAAMASTLFAANPVVYGAMKIRKAVFSQASFKYLRESTGELFGMGSLRILERPWPAGTSAGLLTRMIQHADIGGNSYVLRRRDRLHMMRPDWVSLIMGSQLEPDDPAVAEDAELIGFMYMPMGSEGSARIYLPEEVAHFAPEPDPLAHFRGMSWLTPIIREIQGDSQMTEHKLKFFEQGASPNLIIKFDASQTLAQVKAFKELVEGEHKGVADAYKTMFLGGGADATIVGTDLQQLDFSNTVGKAETRILMAAGVHPVIAGASEGLAGASLNAGNFSQVRRIFSDIHLQDLWNQVAASLEVLVTPLPGTRLAMDGRRIPFLQDDAKDDAEIAFTRARAITLYVREGFTEASAKLAVVAGDETLLQHTGLTSVQLQPPVDPNATDPAGDPAAGQDGTDNLDGTQDPANDPAERALDRAKRLAEVAQKSYLAVGVEISTEESRQLLRDAGWSELAADLPAELQPNEADPAGQSGDNGEGGAG